MKMKNDRHGGGLCHEKDARRSSDDKRCELWSGIKYQRENKNPTPNEWKEREGETK